MNSVIKYEFETAGDSAVTDSSLTLFFHSSPTIEKDVSRFIRDNFPLFGSAPEIVAATRYSSLEEAQEAFEDAGETEGYCWPPFRINTLH